MTAMRLVLGLALCLAVGQAAGQDRGTQVLLDRVERLERSLNDLSRQVYRGEPPRAAPGAAGPVAAPAVDSPAYAQLEARLQQNEEQIRRLTGQIEEVDFRLRRLADRIDKLVTDVDFRLKELEGGKAAAAPGRPTDTLAAGPSAPAGAAPPPPAPVPPGLIVGPQPVAPTPPPAAPAAAPAAKLPDGPPREQYDYAYGLLRRAAFPEAEVAFREFLSRNPNDKLSANAHYWLGETHYVRNQFEQAALAFVEGYKKFPEGAKAPDTLYKLGLTLQKLNQKQEACATFSELVRKFPSADARMKERAEASRKELACR